MIFNDLLQRKLSSILRPWLAHEPQLELKLGFFQSVVVAKNLNFDASALNDLIDDDNQDLRLLFRSVTVDEVIIRVANWRFPAFTIEFSGVNVTLFLEKRFVRKVDISVDDYLDARKKKILAAIDSVGSTLHDNIEKMMMIASSKRHIKDSITNLILMHSGLHLYDVRIQVEYPVSDDLFSWTCFSKEFNAQSSYKGLGSLLGGFISSFFLPLRETSFILEASKLEIGSVKKDHSSCILSCVNPYFDIRMKDRLVVKSSLSVSEMNFSFSPTQIQMMGAFNNLLNIECKHVRSGRLLWGIVRWKIHHSLLLSRCMLYNVTLIALLWLRLVKEYHYFLILVGYSVHGVKMPKGSNRPRLAVQQWKMLSQIIEKELPTQAVASARQVARCRAALEEPHAEDIGMSQMSSDPSSFQKIILWLAFIWQETVKIFAIIMSVFLLLKKSPVDQPRTISEVADPVSCFHLSFGKVSAVVSLKDGSCPPVHKSSKLRKINSYIDRCSLFLVAKGLLFIYEEGISEQYISFILGFLKVTSAPVDLENETRPKNVKGSMKEGLDGSETIVWGESALMCCHSGEIGHEVLPVLEQLSAEMELILKKMQLKFQRTMDYYEDKPWAFCAIHTFWVYPGLESPDSGLLKCDLAAGKLNIALGCSSAASIATLWEQIQHALGQDDGSESAVVTRQSSRTLEESRETNWSVGLKTSMKAMKMPILKYLPNKHFEVRAIIAGPRVDISMRNDEISISKLERNATYGRDGINLTIDVHNIEFAIWPTEKSGVALHEEHQQLNFEPVFCKLEEPAIEKLSGSVNLRYAAKGRVTQCYYLRLGGLKVYFEDMVDNHLMQVLSLKPVTAKLSSLRDYVNSFARTIIASSLSLCGAMSGVTGSFFMDELSIIMLVVKSMLFVASTKPAYGYSRLHAAQNYAVISEDQFLLTVPLDQEILIAAEHEAALTPESSFCSVSASFELVPFDIILHNTRNRTDRKYFSTLFDGYNIQYLSLPELPDTGIWLTIQKICIEAFVGEAKVEANAKFQDFQAIMLRYKNQNGNADELEDSKGVDCLHEISFFNCTINLLVDFLNGSRVNYGAVSETSVRNLKALRTFPSSITGIEGFDSKNIQDEDTESNVPVSMPDFLLLLNSMVDKIYVGPCSIKSGLSWDNPSHKLHLSLSVEGDFQGIAFGIQGGRIIIESTVPARISLCVTLYFQFIKSLLIMDYQHKKSRERADGDSNMFAKENYGESAQTKKPVASSVKQELLQAHSINVSELSLVLLVVDESRVVKEIIGRFDFIVKLWLENQKKKFLVNLSHLNILSLIQSNGMVQSERYVRLPHFSSVGSSYHSLRLNSEVSSGVVPEEEKTSALSNGASSSIPIASSESSFANGASSSVSQSSERQGNYILEQLTAAISAEKPISGDNDGPYCPTQGWVGNGSVSGLNLTVSVSEIQILMAIIGSMSEVSAKGVTKDLEEKSWASLHRESEKDVEAALPDGAIVAIQDVHQHLYIAIESEENKYKLGSTLHYTLAGKRALFRVKWQKRRVWDFSTACFSLMSLYGKSDSGSPLCLNYSGSSDFVDLSGNDGSARALWKIASCKHEIYEDDAVLDPLNHLFKCTYFLVNKKNDCGAAFVHGALEFVKKPGNPFKFKIFHGLLVAPDLRMPETHLPEPHDIAYLDGQDITEEAGMVPCISLTFEKVSLIIVHELSDPKDKLPLLQGSVDGTELKIQILPQKIRVMSSLSAMLYFFDAHRVIWREFVQPIEISIYWRSTTAFQTTEISNQGMRSRLHFRIQELDLSITKLLLDILLYVVGKLDLAGPFAVNNSAVLGNCCKVENQLDLDLICHFPGNQSARVGRRQEAFFFLRHLDPEASHTTIMLDNPGISSTSSVHVPLSRTQFFAWRTQIISQDSQTFPGPFIVFDISKNVEEGLSLDVSPLLKIHNNTGFSVELRIQRPESAAESASVVLRVGETVDDCMASFDAISLSGGPKKALLSLGVGNFMFSFRPEIKEEIDFCKPCSFGWSENIKGEKAVRLSGVIDKLSYQVRKAFSAESWTYSFSTAGCSVISGDTQVAQMYFLVQRIARDVPIMQINDHQKSKSIALQEQKEIFLLPTIRVTNLLESDIDVLLTETEISTIDGIKSINQAIIQHGSTVDLYANPAVIYFNITLSRFSCSCKPVNCSHWLKKLNKKKEGLQFLDIDLDFCGGMYFACLRLARGNRGMLEAIIFTQYTLRNDTDFPLFCAAPHLKPLSRDEAERHAITTPPHHGTLLSPQLIRSWFMKSSKLCIKLLDEESSKSILDLDALSGLAEVRFTKPLGSGMKDLIKLGISLGPVKSEIDVPARMVTLVPRFIISNESDEQVFVRQCFSKDDFGETITISSKQRKALIFRVGSHDERDISVFDKILKKHKVSEDDTSIFVQFSPNETLGGWSGPICVASLGCFFLKFRRHVESPAHQLDLVTRADEPSWEFASVHVVEEGSTFVLHFRRPPDSCPPYRIENHLSDASITYYQKDTFQPETLRSGGSVSYVWDDSTRPHKLIVKINGTHMQREISLDKLRPWKSFYRAHKERDLASPLPLNARALDRRGTNLAQMNGIDVQNVGYEVCVDGPARVLRISHSSNGHRADNKYQSCQKIQLRISYFAIHLLEPCKQFQDQPGDVDPYDLSTYTPIIIGRLENICVDSIIIDQRKYNQIRAQSLHVDVKWVGAPFAAMLRRHLTSNTFTDDSVLFVVFVLFPTTSDIRDVRYSSIILQPVDLNLDEETLMKIVPFWRTSLSSNTQSQQYYFDHFEIHPVKITASFLPEDSPSNYSSGQEALRSLLHSVIKIPAIKNLEVELNGVLISHALVTTRELLLRCARHYSWYGMRAIYIAKGSPLLPPTFASVFDDLASSSLDVFFDPSSSLFNVQGLTLGTFKLIRKCVEDKGFSGTKRYFGDLSKTLQNAGSNVLFAAVTEVSDSVLKGAESSGFNGMMIGFHHGILRLAMEPSLLGTALLEGGSDRRIKLDRSPGIDELYVEGYLQAMLDTIYKQEYLRVRVIDDQVILKNLPPNSSLIDEIMERVKDFLVSKSLLKGDFSTSSRSLRHLRGEKEWRIGPTLLTLCEHLFVSFAIRMLRKQTDNALGKLRIREKLPFKPEATEPSSSDSSEDATSKKSKGKFVWRRGIRRGIGKFALSAMVAYVDGRLCRYIPNPVARRIVSGFLLSFLDNNSSK